MERLKPYLPRLLAAVILAGIGVWLNFYSGSSAVGLAGTAGVTEVRKSTTQGKPVYGLRILFIGNSFTFVNDVPGQLVNIASSDPGNKTQFIVKSVTRGAIGLKELWNDGDALKALRDGPAPGEYWDYVVLQEMSSWAMVADFMDRTYRYAKRFNDAIKQVGAKTLFELTWVNKPGSPLYIQYGYLENPDYMYKRFAANTSELAEHLGATVVPVGTYWQIMLSREPAIELYQPDGHHPGPAGAYLAALTFYKTLTDRDVTNIAYRPPGVTRTEADKIKAVVAHP